MNKSLYTKLVIIMLVLILSIMTVVGAFLVRGVRSFYLSEFYEQMRTVFSNNELVGDLRSAADGEDAPELMAQILRAYSGELGVNSGKRSYYILSAAGSVLTGSEQSAGGKMNITPNILTAISGREGYASDASADYMDVALPITGEHGGSYIVYIIDSKDDVRSLNSRLFEIIMDAIVIGLVISVLLSLLLARTLVTPIRKLTRASEKMAAGDFSAKVDNPAGDEIGVLTRTFNNMAGQLESNIDTLKRSELMRRNFVANVSHELRTPITSIRSYAETLYDSQGMVDEETQRQFLGVIVNESDRMAKIVGDLLTLSRFDAGSIDFTFQTFSFEKSVKDVYSAQLLEAQRRHHEFSLEFKSPIDEIRGDRTRIEQVLINMVSNAIKYTHDGGRIRMTAGQDGNEVWCTVRDNGIGIPKEDLEHIFERFYRVDKARSRESGGTGLGLSIAYEIVERHNGRFETSSQRGRGTSITLILPVEGPSNE
ncbi:MAG: cell wall metabolism sensor histidine kinase WalK [Butyricicoccus sp.]|nr:cell wall metabolism sensor histidine kinase WalK [Butyricicoccus sp.]